MPNLIRGGSHTQTSENIKAFYMRVNPEIPNDQISCLVNIFRHGLAHNYFPKLGQSISYHSKNPNSLFFSDGLGISLNVNMLEQHFIDGFSKIKNDEALYEKMENNFIALTKHYQDHEKCSLSYNVNACQQINFCW
jgi:hypothetical protein